MSLKALSEYTLYAKYSHYLPEKQRRETWPEIVERVFGMHARKYALVLESNPEFKEEFEFAKRMVRKKRVLGSQRALQFGGKWIEKEEFKIYNCSSTYIDRPRSFQESMYVLLCGVGLGFSVQKEHVKKLPKLHQVDGSAWRKWKIDDSIEGWADAIGVIVNSYFAKKDSEFPEVAGHKVNFDYSSIRPEGALIAGQFKAPGPKGLEKAIEKIRSLIERRINSAEFKTDEFAGKLRPIDAYDIIMHASDAVLSGGVRRSATICQFSLDDKEMATAKTGNWFIENPQRARSNNSAVLLKGKTSSDEFHSLMESTRQFGEPGFIWLHDTDVVYNPCAEIGMIPNYNGESGIQVCNLTEINGKFCTSEEEFYEACRASAILGTMQAGYTRFNYLTETTKKIVEREALLGCSITGFMDNPEILLDSKIQRKGAEEIKKTNKKIAAMIGINQSARTTCVKPAGSTSCVLGTASGIHPHHAKRYIRRVQANRNEFPAQHYKAQNPLSIETSVWSANGTDEVVSFLCEVPRGAILKNAISAVQFLDQIKSTQRNWVEYGTNQNLCVKPYVRHNVSCTVVVQPEEWKDVEKFIFNNQEYFSGISLLPSSGDLDYPQAPFSTVLTPEEIVEQYGNASVFASGLTVDGLAAFDNNLWKACDAFLGIGEQIPETMQEPKFPQKNGYTLKEHNEKIIDYYLYKSQYDNWFAKKDWLRRAKQFSERYFNGDDRRMTHCLKHVTLWKTWCDIQREHREVDWSGVIEKDQSYVEASTLGAQACAGGACQLV